MNSNSAAADRIGGVIFDFDGTLVDTMPLHFAAYEKVFHELELQLTRAHFFANIGGTAREAIPKFLNGQRSPVDVAEIHRRKKAVVSSIFETAPITVLETAKLLSVFAPLVPLALASSGSRAGIEILLRRLDWTGYFRAVITGEDVKHGKPAPDSFLLAARSIGVPAETCMVFEDTDAGVAAGLAAGMRVFDVRATVPLPGVAAST